MPYPELDNLFRDLLASNRGPGYEISVRKVTSDRSVIDVDLRFIAGRTYCCAELGCHVPRNSERLLRLTRDRSIDLPQTVRVRWHCYVEKGVRLECIKKGGLPAESEAYDYEQEYPQN